VQGEFGIGLLSFWTVGEELAMSSAGSDGRVYEMRMRKGDPSNQASGRVRCSASPERVSTYARCCPKLLARGAY
jgi:hypothetical protein